eukprot:UN03210
MSTRVQTHTARRRPRGNNNNNNNNNNNPPNPQQDDISTTPVMPGAGQTLGLAPLTTRTTTVTIEEPTDRQLYLVLRRPQERIERNRRILEGNLEVHWDDSVVDNEGMGKKSSKKCCVFRKPKEFRPVK